MKNTIICSFLLFSISVKLFAQLGADGIGVVNGYLIEPNTNLSPSKPKYLTAGYYHNLAIKDDGSIVALGWNNYSQSSIVDNH